MGGVVAKIEPSLDAHVYVHLRERLDASCYFYDAWPSAESKFLCDVSVFLGWGREESPHSYIKVKVLFKNLLMAVQFIDVKHWKSNEPLHKTD